MFMYFYFCFCQKKDCKYISQVFEGSAENKELLYQHPDPYSIFLLQNAENFKELYQLVTPTELSGSKLVENQKLMVKVFLNSMGNVCQALSNIKNRFCQMEAYK